MYISIEELNTHLYSEQIEAISGPEDYTMLTAAIDGAVSEAKGYLHRYDKAAIFAATGESRNALLVIFVKDIAVWHYINLANAGTEYRIRQDRYKAAIDWLKSVQAGAIVPDLPTASAVEGDSGSYAWGSNTKRDNHF